MKYEDISETLGAMLERQAALHPNKDFIVFPDRNLRFTYSAFDAPGEHPRARTGEHRDRQG